MLGIRCDSCDNNYYGNPTVPYGFCELCNCNGNIDPSSPGNCDARTGECLQCLFNTGGYNCEVCEPGYYGDAIQRTCRSKLAHVCRVKTITENKVIAHLKVSKRSTF